MKIRFTSRHNTIQTGFLYTPKRTPAPGLVLTHGFSALMAHGLDGYARYFANAGFVVLIYDHAHFGRSTGHPRQHIDPQQQVADLKLAVDFLAQRSIVNPDKIGLWGTSLSGGHVLSLAAQDPRIKAVVSQTPLVDGHENALRVLNNDNNKLTKQQRLFKRDRQRIVQGHSGATIAVATADNSPAALNDPDAWPFFSQVTSWQPQITLQSLALVSQYRPIDTIAQIHCPTLMIVTDDDQVNHTDLQLKAFQQLSTRKQLLSLPGGHFSVYHQHRFRCLHAAKRLFLQAL